MRKNRLFLLHESGVFPGLIKRNYILGFDIDNTLTADRNVPIAIEVAAVFYQLLKRNMSITLITGKSEEELEDYDTLGPLYNYCRKEEYLLNNLIIYTSDGAGKFRVRENYRLEMDSVFSRTFPEEEAIILSEVINYLSAELDARYHLSAQGIQPFIRNFSNLKYNFSPYGNKDKSQYAFEKDPGAAKNYSSRRLTRKEIAEETIRRLGLRGISNIKYEISGSTTIGFIRSNVSKIGAVDDILSAYCGLIYWGDEVGAGNDRVIGEYVSQKNNLIVISVDTQRIALPGKVYWIGGNLEGTLWSLRYIEEQTRYFKSARPTHANSPIAKSSRVFILSKQKALSAAPVANSGTVLGPRTEVPPSLTDYMSIFYSVDPDLEARYGGVIYFPTHLKYLALLFGLLPQPRDGSRLKVAIIGSGKGFDALYLGEKCRDKGINAEITGFEIVMEFSKTSRWIQEKIGLTNVSFVNTDVLSEEVDFSDYGCIYIYPPLSKQERIQQLLALKLLRQIKSGAWFIIQEEGLAGTFEETLLKVSEQEGIERRYESSYVAPFKVLMFARASSSPVKRLLNAAAARASFKYISISQGGDKSAVSLNDGNNVILSYSYLRWEESFPDWDIKKKSTAETDADDVLKVVARQIIGLLEQHSIDPRSIHIVSANLCGPVDKEKSIYGSDFPVPNLPFSNYPFQNRFAALLNEADSSLQVKVVMCNDAEGAVKGETYSPKGLLSKVKDGGIVIIGGGINITVKKDGAVYFGALGEIKEAGHNLYQTIGGGHYFWSGHLTSGGHPIERGNTVEEIIRKSGQMGKEFVELGERGFEEKYPDYPFIKWGEGLRDFEDRLSGPNIAKRLQKAGLS
ncbi:MAG: hypothetical protein PHW54_07480, partial [Candidatus Omnitrophica bacterium]|nr:hypothetical protein [Candidatus Omnitrophota bacterium]